MMMMMMWMMMMIVVVMMIPSTILLFAVERKYLILFRLATTGTSLPHVVRYILYTVAQHFGPT